MSGSSTASSAPPDTTSAADGSGRGTKHDGSVTTIQQAFIDALENPEHQQTQHRQTQSSNVTVRRDDVPSEDYATTSAESSHQATMRRDGLAHIDVTRPIPSHPARDRKRRLTGAGDHARLQRTRSGEGSGQVSMGSGPLPQRPASMTVPSSRNASSAIPGSSYDMAIDITSSSPPSPYHSSGEAHAPSSENAPSGSNEAQSNRPLPASFNSASRAIHYRNEDGGSSDFRPYSWNGSGMVVPETQYQGSNAGRATLMSHSSGTMAGRYGNAFRGVDSSVEASQSARSPQDEQSRSTRMSNASWSEQYPRMSTRRDSREHQEGLLTSTNEYYPGARSFTRGLGPARENIRHGSDAYGGPFSSGQETRRTSSGTTWQDREEDQFDELTLPRWQPDSEVSECPICGTVFSFWYRKHHCRKCGRVVCASCSPHRITIPRQFIVRPPDSTTLPSSVVPPTQPTIDLTDEASLSSLFGNPALGGGEEVRLCNPCVPDPNPNPPGYSTLRPHGHRSSHSLSSTMGNACSSGRRLNRSDRQERRTVGAHDRPSFLHEVGRQNIQTPPGRTSHDLEVRRARRASANVDSASNRVTTTRVAPRPVISERDLCPICGQLFPPITEEHPLESREGHTRQCIESFCGGPAQQESSEQRPISPLPPAVARMIGFKATEKDCLGENGQIAECTICMEEYEVGQHLARLQCFCKFHRTCISDWFERKTECPVHKVS